MNFFSFGLKRYLASALTALAGVLGADPATAFLLPIVSQLAALLGLTGLVHAGKEGTIFLKKSLSISALFPILISLADHFPQLAPYKELLVVIGTLLGINVIASNSPASASDVREVKATAKKK